MIQSYRVRPESVQRPTLDGQVRVLWVIPKVPPSLNQWQGMHWGAQQRQKKAWEEFVWALSRQNALPPNCEWIYATAEIVFRKGAHRDLTNYTATLQKIFPDVLMRVGVLADDTEEQMRWGQITMSVDKRLRNEFSDPRLQGMTRIAMIAQEKHTE